MKYVYILQSVGDAEHFYVGMTENVDARLINHADESRASEFEKYLKSGSGRAFAKKRL